MSETVVFCFCFLLRAVHFLWYFMEVVDSVYIDRALIDSEYVGRLSSTV